MSQLFLKLVNMSISASWLVLVVLILRLALKKAPRWINVLLWAIVAVRLLLPFSIESVLSLIPSSETINPEIVTGAVPTINTGIPAIHNVVNPVISQTFAPSPGAGANPLQLWISVLAVTWAIGAAGLLAYTVVSYWLLRRKVDTAVLLRDNIFQSENVGSPFVLGIIRPKIYLPFKIDRQDIDHVIAHERAHIRRRDHWWKPLGFLLLAVYWFNPLTWLAYVLLCRDIELACDEKVIKELGNEQRADYTQALLACSVNRRMIAACPLAFGEVGVKERVKSVMNYRKPAFWVIILAVIACIVMAVCFLTDPKNDGPEPDPDGTTGSGNIPAEDKIRQMLEAGESGIYWAVEDGFSRTGDITVYETVSLDVPLWDKLFSQVEIVSREEWPSHAYLTVSIEGLEYSVDVVAHAIGFFNRPEHPDILAPETLMAALSGITGMDWKQEEQVYEDRVYYRNCVDGLPVDRSIYFVGENGYSGPYLGVFAESVDICVPFRLGPGAGTVEAGTFVTPEEVELVCSAYWQPRLDLVDFSPEIVIFDRAELVYYYQAQLQQLLPAYSVTGRQCMIGSLGRFDIKYIAHLIDAQTGELITMSYL